MKRDEFLNQRFFPFIINGQQTGWIIGVHQDAVNILVRVGHLEPLEIPPPGAQRYVSSREILKLADDIKRMRKVVRIVREHYRRRNSRHLGCPAAEI